MRLHSTVPAPTKIGTLGTHATLVHVARTATNAHFIKGFHLQAKRNTHGAQQVVLGVVVLHFRLQLLEQRGKLRVLPHTKPATSPGASQPRTHTSAQAAGRQQAGSMQQASEPRQTIASC